MVQELVQVRKDAIVELVKVRDRFDAIVESLELMSDEKFMTSYKKAKEQVARREFEKWDEL